MEAEGTEVQDHRKKEGLRRLREADFIVPQQKVGVFLLTERLKPATSVLVLFQPGNPRYTGEAYTADLQKMALLLDDLGLPYRVDQSEDEYAQVAEFSIGRDEAGLEALLATDEIAEREERERLRGAAYGNPVTAVEGMIAGQVLLSAEHPPELSRDPSVKFAQFSFSRDYWREELEVVRVQAEVIRQKDPELYKQIAGI